MTTLFLLVLGILGTAAMLGLVTMTVTKNFSGFSAGTGTGTFTDELGTKANPTVPAGQTGTLTTRTSNTAGTITMASVSHTIITGQRIDIYWNGAFAYAATVGTVSGVLVPFTGAAGTALPLANTVVTVGSPILTPFVVVGNNMQVLICATDQTGLFVFEDGGHLLTISVEAGDVFEWDVDTILANPLAGDSPTKVYMSHSGLTAPSTKMQTVAISH